MGIKEIGNDGLGETMYRWACDLFPINRSITGEGVRETLGYLQQILPNLGIFEVPTGTKAFDWVVPEEWNIEDAFISDSEGRRIVDYKENNLHVVSYSKSVDRWLTFRELDESNHLFSLPKQKNAIPYVTSYYSSNWGFCLTENLRNELRRLPDKEYHVKISSTLKKGALTYGEVIIPGESAKEVLLSTYICHPSMANNELSGPVVATALAKWLSEKTQNPYYTYRIIFVPETIGSIVYLSRHLETMKKQTIAGFVIACVGDDRNYSYLKSRIGDTLVDRVCQHVMKHNTKSFKTYSFLERGSDERQYCSPGIDLPVCSISRTKYDEYPEYHTSLDNLNIITPSGLEGGYIILKKCIQLLENNRTYQNNVLCEPQLGKRGLYPKVSSKDTHDIVINMLNFLAYADGKHDLVEIAEIIGVQAEELFPIIKELINSHLISSSLE
jgi:aminopeptidase-like protein